MEVQDRIAETFAGKKVLISGGSGFLGKVIVEKLLRTCTKVSEIILILREKKGKEPKQRLQEIFSNPIFEPLIQSRGLENIMKVMTIVNGDMLEQDLGLSQKDRDICKTANIIVHSAANVRFDVGIKEAILMNTRGAKFMLDLAKQCPNLELFFHISTAYCHPEEKVLEERTYPPPNDPNDVIAMMENLDAETIDVLSPKLLGEFPNTYAYSKALAEALVEECIGTLPVIIVRPSVVVPVYLEPIKGWTDNINGPIGLLIGAGKGVIRSMYGDSDGFADFVPVDSVANVLLVLTWDYLKNDCRLAVMNITTSEEVQVTWKECIDIGRELVCTKLPFDTMLWYPGGGMTRCLWWHKIRAVLFHWLPAILVDTLLFCLGYKPLLVKIQTRISKSMSMFEYYTRNQWHFKSDALRQMRQKLNETEKQLYVLHSEGLNIREYFEHGILAARRYILKEKDENIPRSRRIIKILYWLDLTIKTIFCLYVAYWINKLIM